MEIRGTGNFTWGYFGGLTLAPPARAGVDAATGLMYIGNGLYYDPATFTRPSSSPDKKNIQST